MRADETKADEAQQKRVRRLARDCGYRLIKPRPFKWDGDWIFEDTSYVLVSLRSDADSFSGFDDDVASYSADYAEYGRHYSDLDEELIWGSLDELETKLRSAKSSMYDKVVTSQDGEAVWVMPD